MFKRASSKDRRAAIHDRVRERVRGTAARPRLAVFKSDRHIYAQIIDDEAGQTLVSASTLSKVLRGSVPRRGSVAAAKAIGDAVATAAAAKNIEQVVFDRGGFVYHGAVKALADAARAKGLKF